MNCFIWRQSITFILIILCMAAARLSYADLTVISTVPAPGETGVVAPVDSPIKPTGGFIKIRITFNMDIDSASVNNSTIELSDGTGRKVEGKISHDANTLVFLPNTILDNGGDYTVVIARGVKSLTGDALTDDYTFTFRTKGLEEYYVYDKTIPLEVEASVTERFGYNEYQLTYTSVNKEKVPALFLVPKTGIPPYPCLIYMHGHGGSKDDMKQLATFAVALGYAAFAIDAQYHGERQQPEKDIFAANAIESRNSIVQTIIDCMRGVDYLETRSDIIDMKQIGFLGTSMGAIFGSVFVAMDARIKGAILIVGGGPLTLIFEKTTLEPVRGFQPTLTIPYTEVQKILDPIDPTNFIGKIAPRPILMQNALLDDIVPPQAGELMFQAANMPKEIDWYDDDHLLSNNRFRMMVRIIDWMETRLFIPENPWDVNGDQQVDISDLLFVGKRIGAKGEFPKEANPDVNRDGVVDISDLVIVGIHFGETYN